MKEQQGDQKTTYGKKSLWQWIILYLIIGVIVYALIYFIVLHKGNNPYMYKNAANMPQAQNSIYKMMSKEKLGTVMTDQKGMTLYTFAKDTSGMSNCTGACLQAWPAYAAATKTGNMPVNITIITRPDGTSQYAWKGKPLYYYAKDGDSGDAYGNGIGGVWSVITN